MAKREKATMDKKNKSGDKVKITVERVFGNLDLINLYAEYVAEKILDKGLIVKNSA